MNARAESALVVDRKGLAKKIANRPKSFILYELLQNAWDENVRVVKATAEMLPGRPVCRITVEDDSPDGFSDLHSVYTLFKDSKKAPDPTKRGRFEMGEKLVLALALEAEIRTTKGTVRFEGPNFERSVTNQASARREEGTLFTGTFRMTREEFEQLCTDVKLLSAPNEINTFFNDERLYARLPLHTFRTSLQTVRSDDEGNLVPTHRQADVHVYRVLRGETAHIFEMGIPIVETGDKWHYDVQQRVPVNWERNNVPPSYLRALRVEVLNALHDHVGSEEATSSWVGDAAEDQRCDPEAIRTVVSRRFGDKAVIYDPSDPEGTKIAVSQGYTVIPGGAFSKRTWDNIRAAKAVLPAGQVTPSPKPYDPDGTLERVIPEEDWTPAMRRKALFSCQLFNYLLGKELDVVIVTEPQASWVANFGRNGNQGRLCLNYGRLGKRWFDLPKRDEEVLDLLLHEFCHYEVSDHLSHEMHEMATKLGARLANLALNEPELFAL